MATWKSIAKMVFTLDHWQTGDYDISYEETTLTWEYNTTSDSLAVKRTTKRNDVVEFFSNGHAEAQLKVLANWYATYEGKGRLKDLLKEELDGED